MSDFKGDFRIQDEGSLVILYPLTQDAVDWITMQLPADHLTWGGRGQEAGVVIEPRYVNAILNGLSDDGLTVVEG